MEMPLRMTCNKCGRSMTWSDEGVVEPLSTCPICGGRVGLEPSSDADFELATTETPASLQLTPDELGAEAWSKECERASLTSVGRFQIRELLGGGGFGYVYRAFDSRLERDVALKVLRESHPPARVIERFFREARAAAQLDHPNIVSLYDAGRDEGKCWISYQFIAGTTLARFREMGHRDHRFSARVALSLADALVHAHGRGVYHRDLKPANVMVDPLGRPHLTDFGLARRIDFEPTMTREGAVLGTMHYIPPEQASGNSHLADGRSDIYSLGVIFYEMLCGRRPVDLPSNAPSWKATRDRSPVVRPRRRDRTIPIALDQICVRALAPNPDDRYTHAREMADELRRWLDERPVRNSRAILVAGIFLAAMVAREGLALAAANWSPPVTDKAATQPQTTSRPTPHQAIALIAEPKNPVAQQTFVVTRPEATLHLREDCPSIKAVDEARRERFATIEKARTITTHTCEECLKAKPSPSRK